MKKPVQSYNMKPVVPSLNFEHCAPLGALTPINVMASPRTKYRDL